MSEERINSNGPIKPYFEKQGDAPAPPPPVTKAHRLLLLGVAALGALFAWISCDSEIRLPGFTNAYGAFWLLYLGLYYWINWQKAKARPLSHIFSGSAAALMVLNILQGYRPGGEMGTLLTVFNLIAIPALLMLHAQVVSRPLPREREGVGYLFLFFHGFFVQPFLCVTAFFRAIGSMFGKQSKKRAGAWVGVLVAIPLSLMALSLLAGADAVFASMLRQWTENLRLGPALWRIALSFVTAMLFYSFLYYQASDKRAPYGLTPPPVKMPWEPAGPAIVLGALLFVYAVFTYVQFVYLFGGAGLPEGLTYAQYAHQGFGQLIVVSGVNIAAYTVCMCRGDAGKPLLKGLLLALLLSTGIIIASAFTRIGMYIGAYGLTLARVMVVWLLLYLTAVCVLGAIRLLKGNKFPLLRLCVYGLPLWYIALNILDFMGLYAA